MNPAEVSGALRSPAGFHLLQLADRLGAGAPGGGGAPDRMRHILIRHERGGVRVGGAPQAARPARSHRLRGRDFAELARVHSATARRRAAASSTGSTPATRAGVRARLRELKVARWPAVRHPVRYHL